MPALIRKGNVLPGIVRHKTHTFLKYIIMKSIIKQLFFDKELVGRIKESKTNKAVLYSALLDGRITLSEYMAAIKA